MAILLKNRRAYLFWLLLAAGALLASILLVETRETSSQASGTYLQGYGLAESSSPGSYRMIMNRENDIVAEYGFQNFNDDALNVSFTVTRDALERYRLDYGYRPSELDALHDWQKKALTKAHKFAVDNRLSQGELDQMGARIQENYHDKVRQLVTSRGFRYKEEDLLVPDMPKIVRQNIRSMRPLALELNRIARAKRYDAVDVVGTALSLVQTGLEYDDIPLQERGRVTGGIYPPMVTMVEGRGDCDSKTAVMASVLLNWTGTRLVGVGIPDHYLVGVLQNPAKGDAYVEYEGLSYVLMEPSGPAWLAPGTISDYTMDMLNAGDGITLEALTRH